MAHLRTLVTLAVLLPGSLAAQPTSKSPDELREILRPGQTVTVTDAQGTRLSGTIADISSNALTLVARDTHDGVGPRRMQRETLAWDRIQTVRRSDRRWNGLVLGLAAGIAATAAWRAGCGGVFQSEDVTHDQVRACRAAATGSATLVLAPAAAGLGLLIDSFSAKRFTLRHNNNRLAVSPQLSPRGVGVSASFELGK